MEKTLRKTSENAQLIAVDAGFGCTPVIPELNMYGEIEHLKADAVRASCGPLPAETYISLYGNKPNPAGSRK